MLNLSPEQQQILVDAVANMRRLQKNFFRQKTGLGACRTAEREVDHLIKRIKSPPAPALFDKDNAAP